MDDFLNDVEVLANVAALRPPPAFNATTIMRTVSATRPVPYVGDNAVRFLAGVSAVAAAACLAIVLFASSAWLDLHNPFLAMESVVNPMEWLR